MSFLNQIATGNTVVSGHQDLEAKHVETIVASNEVEGLFRNLESAGNDIDRLMVSVDVESASVAGSDDFAKGVMAGMNVAFRDATALTHDVESIADGKAVLVADMEAKQGFIAKLIEWLKGLYQKVLNKFKQWGKKIGSLFARIESKIEAFKKEVDDFKFDKDKKDEKFSSEELQTLMKKYRLAATLSDSFTAEALITKVKDLVAVDRKNMGTVALEKSVSAVKNDAEATLKDSSKSLTVDLTGLGYNDSVVTISKLLSNADAAASSMNAEVSDETYNVVGLNGTTAKVIIQSTKTESGLESTTIKSGTIVIDDSFIKGIKKDEKIQESHFTALKTLASTLDSNKKMDKEVYDEQYKKLSEIETLVSDIFEAIDKFAESDNAADNSSNIVNAKNNLTKLSKSIAVVAPQVAHGLVEDSYKIPLAAIAIGEFVLGKLPKKKKD